MELKQYLSELLPDQRQAFALSCGTTAKHLQNAAYGQRPLAAKVCVAVERNSLKKVTRLELKPDDWHLIWPELVSKQARTPKVSLSSGPKSRTTQAAV